MSESCHDRSDASAWQGNASLALVVGYVAGVLMRHSDDMLWTVEMPQGYAPVIDLTMQVSGKRFRLAVEEVKEGG